MKNTILLFLVVLIIVVFIAYQLGRDTNNKSVNTGSVDSFVTSIPTVVPTVDEAKQMKLQEIARLDYAIQQDGIQAKKYQDEANSCPPAPSASPLESTYDYQQVLNYYSICPTGYMKLASMAYDNANQLMKQRSEILSSL